MLILQYRLLQTVAGTAGNGNYLFSLPAGFSLNTIVFNLGTAGLYSCGSCVLSQYLVQLTFGLVFPTATAFSLFTPAGGASGVVGSGTYPLSATNMCYTANMVIPVF